MASGKRQYGQLCGLAVGLDIIGERWTLLVLRELMVAPARFNELADSLPGMGATLLTHRLRSLVEQGLVRQDSVLGDARGRVYSLTDVGEGLRAPLLGLAKWGLNMVTADDVEDAVVKSSWARLAVEGLIQGRRLPRTVTETYQFEIDQSSFHVKVTRGIPRLADGTAPQWSMRMRTDASTFVQVGARIVAPDAAIASGDLALDGPAEAILRCATLLGMDGQ